MSNIKLSIIIPCYNAEPYVFELLDRLNPQITDEVEVILVDDGSDKPVESNYKWLRIERQENKGCATARNKGLDLTSGEYVSFIDADDLVSVRFVQSVFETIKQKPDVIELSWRNYGNGAKHDYKLNSLKDRLPNPSVCTRVFKRAFIGDVRFNVKKDSTEDEDFSRKIGYLIPDSKIKRAIITDYMYFYRTDVVNSKIKRYAAGMMNTKRVVYYYDVVTADMKWLFEEIKEEDEINEVFLMTNRCDLKGIERYCKVIKPRSFWGHIVRGQPYAPLVEKTPPYKTQIVLYRKGITQIGGLSSFIDNFLDKFIDKYDITIMADTIDVKRLNQWRKKVKVIAAKVKENGAIRNLVSEAPFVMCDNLIMLSFLDSIPNGIKAKNIIRMCHACKTDARWRIEHDYNDLVFVSETAMMSHGYNKDECKVIHNVIKKDVDKALILVSATRFPAPDKGKIEFRMRKLAEMLNEKKIKYIWLNFANGKLKEPPKNFYNMGTSSDMASIIKAADYVVQLSDSECWSYSCLESLVNKVPLICTPFPSTVEMGIIDGVNAHIVPFDLNFDVTKLLDIPVFDYEYDNDSIIKQWVELLGDKKPQTRYEPVESVRVRVRRIYDDVLLGKRLYIGQKLYMDRERADYLQDIKKLVEIIL